MKYTKLKIKNFKGIKKLELDLNQNPKSKIFTLVGLNESGKTSILEAINLIQNKISDDEAHKMIHKSQQFNFNSLHEEIERKIGTENNYIGFDMSKTHSQDNSKIDEHNLNILKKFSHLIIPEEIHSMLDCWKGMMFFSPTRNFNDNIKEFGGWGSHDILYWLLTKGYEWIILKNIEDIEEQITKEEGEENISRTISKDLRYKVLKRQHWRCNLCNCSLKWDKDSVWEGEVAHIDHIHPYSKKESYPNGKENINELPNLQALCPKDNLSKGQKEIN